MRLHSVDKNYVVQPLVKHSLEVIHKERKVEVPIFSMSYLAGFDPLEDVDMDYFELMDSNYFGFHLEEIAYVLTNYYLKLGQEAVMEAVRKVKLRPRERVTFEYVLLGGVTDGAGKLTGRSQYQRRRRCGTASPAPR